MPGSTGFEPLPLAIGIEALPVVTAALERGERAVHAVLPMLRAIRVPLTEHEAQLLTNINTPEEYARVRAGDDGCGS